MQPRHPTAEHPNRAGQQPAMTFRWVPCPMHRWFGQAGAIVVQGGDPWCCGDGAEVRGHWVEEKAA